MGKFRGGIVISRDSYENSSTHIARNGKPYACSEFQTSGFMSVSGGKQGHGRIYTQFLTIETKRISKLAPIIIYY